MIEKTPATSRSHRFRIFLMGLAAAALCAAILSAGLYGVRSYRTFLLLTTARSLGDAEVSSIRGWMTLDYLSETYGADPGSLRRQLGLPPGADGSQSLRDVAARKGTAVFDEVKDVQRILARPGTEASDVPATAAEPGLLAGMTDTVMSYVLQLRYPVLLAVVFLGSLGFPVPAGPAAALSGSLAVSGQMGTAAVVLISFAGSLAGDVLAYAVGRAASPAWLSRWGRWLGYSEAARLRANGLFQRWGAAAVVLSMSVMSQISSVTGLLAGLSHWSLPRYVLSAAAGRLFWVLGYVGLGYAAGTSFAAASGFLFNLGLLLLSLLAVAASLGYLLRQRSLKP